MLRFQSELIAQRGELENKVAHLETELEKTQILIGENFTICDKYTLPLMGDPKIISFSENIPEEVVRGAYKLGVSNLNQVAYSESSLAPKMIPHYFENGFLIIKLVDLMMKTSTP